MTRDLNLVVVLTAVAQVAAFLKSILIAYFFGVGAELDGYFLAQVVPAVVTGTAIGALQSSFVPTYVRLKTDGRADDASRLAGHLLQIILLAGAVLSAVVAVFAAQIVHLTAPLAEPGVTAAAIYSLRVLSLLLLLNALVDFLALVLHAELRFAAATLAPIGNALAASVFLVMVPELGLANLVWGTLLGLAVQILILAYAMWKARVKVLFGIRSNTQQVWVVGRLSARALPAVVIANVAANIPSVLAATLGAGAVSVFSYAWKLNQAAVQAAGIAIGTVLLPHFSQMLASKDHERLWGSLSRVLPVVFAIGGLAVIWIWVAGEPFLRAAFQRGKFSDEDVAAVHQLWLLLALGLAPLVASFALAKVIQASGAFALLAWFGLGGAVLLFAVSSLLMPAYGIGGVAIGSVASTWGVLALCAVAVSKRVPRPAKHFPVAPVRSLLLIFSLTAAATYLVRLLPDTGNLLPVLAASVASGMGAMLLLRRA